MDIEIKKVASCSPANISKLTIMYDIFVNGKFYGYTEDLMEAIAIKEDFMDPDSERMRRWVDYRFAYRRGPGK